MKLYVFSVKRVKKFLFPLISAFFCALILYTFQNPSVLAIKNFTNNQIFYHGNLNDQRIALTFNITMEGGNITPLLTLLKDKQIENATFFITNDVIEKSPKIIEKIAKMGYEIGILGDKNKKYDTSTRLQLAKEFEKAKNSLKACNIASPKWLRLPNGDYTEDALDIAKQSGLTFIHWSIIPPEQHTLKVSEQLRQLETQFKTGDVLVFEPVVPNIKLLSDLEKMLPELKKRGYIFNNITDLITDLHFQTKEIQ